MKKICLLLLVVYTAVASSGDLSPPRLDSSIKAMCGENPYDCKSNEIVTPHLINTLLYRHYLEVEDYFFHKGFSSAEFEYCKASRCLQEGVHVKNSEYQITALFPRKKEYFSAFGGTNKNEGVYFLKEFAGADSNEVCSVRVRSGNEISKKSSRAIADGSVINLRDFRNKFYKKYKLVMAQYLPSIDALNVDDGLPLAECWLRYNSKKIIFEITGDIT
jgi:hypothetical protein